MNSMIVIITGASRGIGKAIALEFARHHASICINASKSPDALNETAGQIRSLGGRCVSFCGDISSYSVCQELVSTCIKAFGPPTLLINNAGISQIGLFQDYQPEEWKRLMDVNLGSVFNLSHLVIPYFVAEHRGKIINISSVWGNCGASCEAVYSASKGAVNSFTKALGKELAPSGIQVNAISCGAIATSMNAWMSPEDEQALIEEIPASRLGLPEEAARLAWQLSTAPDYLTGQIITLDGGWI